MIAILEFDFDNEIKLASEDLLDTFELGPERGFELDSIGVILQSTVNHLWDGRRKVELENMRTIVPIDLLGSQLPREGLESVALDGAISGMSRQDGS